MLKPFEYSIIALCLILGACIGFSSCGNNGCEETRETFLYVDLKPVTGRTISTLYTYAITNEADSLMSVDTKPNNLELILEPGVSSTQFMLLMTINDNGDLYQYADTLTVSYESFAHFIDMECGCSIYFDILDAQVTNQTLRGVTIKHSQITNEENINLTIEY